MPGAGLGCVCAALRVSHILALLQVLSEWMQGGRRQVKGLVGGPSSVCSFCCKPFSCWVLAPLFEGLKGWKLNS